LLTGHFLRALAFGCGSVELNHDLPAQRLGYPFNDGDRRAPNALPGLESIQIGK
jgi:hypothetical protein